MFGKSSYLLGKHCLHRSYADPPPTIEQEGTDVNCEQSVVWPSGAPVWAGAPVGVAAGALAGTLAGAPAAAGIETPQS